MTARRVALLFAAGFVVIAIAIWLSSTRHLERDTAAGDLVIPGLEKALNDVSQVTLVKGDETKTTLRKGATDWTVAERGYPADGGKVRKFLLDLGSLNVVEEKTRTPANYPQLGVEDVSSPKATGTRVDVVTPSKTHSLIVGKSAGAKSGYVRLADSAQSLLAAPALSVDTDPRRWIDRTFLDIQQERVKEFTVKPADSPGYTASRPNKEQTDFAVSDIPKGRELSNPTAADPIAGSLASLNSDDVQHAPAQPVDPKSVAHATFKTFDGLTLALSGRKDGARTLVAVDVSSSDKATQSQAEALTALTHGWEYEIPPYKYDAIFRPLEDLLKKLPEKKSDAKKPAATAIPQINGLRAPKASAIPRPAG